MATQLETWETFHPRAIFNAVGQGADPASAAAGWTSDRRLVSGSFVSHANHRAHETGRDRPGHSVRRHCRPGRDRSTGVGVEQRMGTAAEGMR